jgi:protein TonB
MANGRLFRWNFAAVSQAAMKKAVATLNAIKKVETVSSSPEAKLEASDSGAPKGIGRMSLPPKVLAASIRKKVDPDCVPAGTVLSIVTIHVIVDQQGNVSHLGVAGLASIDAPAAVDAVSKWKYKPFVVNGQATEVDSTVDVSIRACYGPSVPDKYTLGVR